jgi:hypothetical protein
MLRGFRVGRCQHGQKGNQKIENLKCNAAEGRAGVSTRKARACWRMLAARRGGRVSRVSARATSLNCLAGETSAARLEGQQVSAL